MAETFRIDYLSMSKQSEKGAALCTIICMQLKEAEKILKDIYEKINENPELYINQYNSIKKRIEKIEGMRDYNPYVSGGNTSGGYNYTGASTGQLDGGYVRNYKQFPKVFEQYAEEVDKPFALEYSDAAQILADLKIQDIYVEDRNADGSCENPKRSINAADILNDEEIKDMIKISKAEEERIYKLYSLMIEKNAWPEGMTEEEKNAIKNYVARRDIQTQQILTFKKYEETGNWPEYMTDAAKENIKNIIQNYDENGMETYEAFVQNMLHGGDFEYISIRDINKKDAEIKRQQEIQENINAAIMVGSIALDFIPVVGEIKGIIEAGIAIIKVCSDLASSENGTEGIDKVQLGLDIFDGVMSVVGLAGEVKAIKGIREAANLTEGAKDLSLAQAAGKFIMKEAPSSLAAGAGLTTASLLCEEANMPGYLPMVLMIGGHSIMRGRSSFKNFAREKGIQNEKFSTKLYEAGKQGVKNIVQTGKDFNKAVNDTIHTGKKIDIFGLGLSYEVGKNFLKNHKESQNIQKYKEFEKLQNQDKLFAKLSQDKQIKDISQLSDAEIKTAKSAGIIDKNGKFKNQEDLNSLYEKNRLDLIKKDKEINILMMEKAKDDLIEKAAKIKKSGVGSKNITPEELKNINVNSLQKGKITAEDLKGIKLNKEDFTGELDIFKDRESLKLSDITESIARDNAAVLNIEKVKDYYSKIEDKSREIETQKNLFEKMLEKDPEKSKTEGLRNKNRIIKEEDLNSIGITRESLINAGITEEQLKGMGFYKLGNNNVVLGKDAIKSETKKGKISAENLKKQGLLNDSIVNKNTKSAEFSKSDIKKALGENEKLFVEDPDIKNQEKFSFKDIENLEKKYNVEIMNPLINKGIADAKINNVTLNKEQIKALGLTREELRVGNTSAEKVSSYGVENYIKANEVEKIYNKLCRSDNEIKGQKELIKEWENLGFPEMKNERELVKSIAKNKQDNYEKLLDEWKKIENIDFKTQNLNEDMDNFDEIGENLVKKLDGNLEKFKKIESEQEKIIYLKELEINNTSNKLFGKDFNEICSEKNLSFEKKKEILERTQKVKELKEEYDKIYRKDMPENVKVNFDNMKDFIVNADDDTFFKEVKRIAETNDIMKSAVIYSSLNKGEYFDFKNIAEGRGRKAAEILYEKAKKNHNNDERVKKAENFIDKNSIPFDFSNSEKIRISQIADQDEWLFKNNKSIISKDELSKINTKDEFFEKLNLSEEVYIENMYEKITGQKIQNLVGKDKPFTKVQKQEMLNAAVKEMVKDCHLDTADAIFVDEKIKRVNKYLNQHKDFNIPDLGNEAEIKNTKNITLKKGCNLDEIIKEFHLDEKPAVKEGKINKLDEKTVENYLKGMYENPLTKSKAEKYLDIDNDGREIVLKNSEKIDDIIKQMNLEKEINEMENISDIKVESLERKPKEEQELVEKLLRETDFTQDEIREIIKMKNTGYKITLSDGSEILLTTYKRLKNKPGQAHHINQDAAFRNIIPTDEAITIMLEGNILEEPGTSHHAFHKEMEKFWNSKWKDKRGVKKFDENYSYPTVGEYNEAVEQALMAAGFNKADAEKIMMISKRQQELYKIKESDTLKYIPAPISLAK